VIDAEDLLSQAEDIFFELASDNLSKEVLDNIQLQPHSMFLEIHDNFSNNWEELLYESIDGDE